MTEPYACWFLWHAYYIEDLKWRPHSQFGVAFWWVVLREAYFEGPNRVWRALKTSILNTGGTTLNLMRCTSWPSPDTIHMCGALGNLHSPWMMVGDLGLVCTRGLDGEVGTCPSNTPLHLPWQNKHSPWSTPGSAQSYVTRSDAFALGSKSSRYLLILGY